MTPDRTADIVPLACADSVAGASKEPRFPARDIQDRLERQLCLDPSSMARGSFAWAVGFAFAMWGVVLTSSFAIVDVITS